ncbi:LysM peptidoglycan-binding domain-containing protein [Nonomuraea insulae]|uniref:LysM peptidoglycan-binding domain-containing protein n=1 Tax=Nonomuraea insulae TaxID=1616787 RepID=A0ABW1DE69_9ACTN
MIFRLLRALVAYVVLLAAVLGLPILLYTLAGPPFPDRLPSLAQIASTLASPDDGTLFVAALELLLWLTWAHFTLSVLCEIAAKARGRRLSPSFPRLPGVHRLAAYLVASATLTVLAPGVSNAAAPPPVVSMAPLHPLGQVADEAPQTYEVKQGDTLWKIADEELDSPRRWPKIWETQRPLEAAERTHLHGPRPDPARLEPPPSPQTLRAIPHRLCSRSTARNR